MTDVCQNWRSTEVNKKNRAEIRRIDDPHSYYHGRGARRRIHLSPWLSQLLPSALFTDCRYLHTQWHHLWQQEPHYLDDTHTSPDWQSTSVYCGLNLYYWNERFHGNNSINNQRSSNNLYLLTQFGSLLFYWSYAQKPSAKSHKKSERKILNDWSQQTILFWEPWTVGAQNPPFECTS